MIVLVAAALLSAILVWLVRLHAIRMGVLDAPNARSSHRLPTPRGGGLGLIVAMGAVYGATGVAGLRDWQVLSAALAVGIVAAIGRLDDHGSAPVGVRLAVHAGAGVLILPIAVGAPLPMPALLAAAWWVFWTVSSINIVNFIDGIDGLIGITTLVYAVFLALGGQPDGPVATGGLALAGASVGFLLWNWSPASIFLGDTGSGAIGVIQVALGATLVAEGSMGFVAAFAPLAPICLDAVVTLFRRWRRGDPLSQAHRSHLYQRLANGGMGHARVAQLYGAAAAGCGAIALAWPQGGGLLLVTLLAVLLAAGALLERHAVLPTSAQDLII